MCQLCPNKWLISVESLSNQPESIPPNLKLLSPSLLCSFFGLVAVETSVPFG